MTSGELASPYWAVVVTQPNAEKKALLNLEDQGFVCYHPKMKIKKVVRGRKVTSSQRVFPRYIFVLVEGLWRSLLGTFGVAYILQDAGKPARVSTSVIDGLKAREDRNGFVRSQFAPGQKLVVAGGKLDGKVVIYAEMTAKQRVLALLDAMGRKVQVELDFGSVSAV